MGFNPENPFKAAPKAEAEPRKEYRERLLEGLDREVSFVATCIERVQKMGPETEAPDLQEFFLRGKAVLDQVLPCDTDAHADRITVLEGQVRKLRVKIKAVGDAGEEGLFVLYKQKHETEDEIERLLTDPAFMAHQRFGKFSLNLQQKLALVKGLREEGLPGVRREVEVLCDKYHALVPDLDAAKLTFGTFDVTIEIAENELQELRTDKEMRVDGLYFPNTPFCFVSRSAKRKMNTMRHERVHNLVSGVVMNRTKDSWKDIDTFREMAEGFGVDIVDFMELAEHQRPSFILDGTHEEILAELEGSERRSFGHDPHGTEVDRTHAFSTAGHDIRGVMRKLREETPLKEKEPKLKVMDERIADGLALSFERMTQALERSFSFARLMPDPDKAVTYMHALCFALRPSQYVHAEKLLRRHFGEEASRSATIRTEAATALQEDPERGLEILKELRKKGLGMGEDLFRILADDPFYIVRTFGITDLGRLRELASTFDMSVLREKSAIDRLYFAFFSDQMEEYAKNGFRELREFSAKLTEEEKEELRHAADICFEDASSAGYIWGESLPEMDWRILEELGIAQYVRRVLEDE